MRKIFLTLIGSAAMLVAVGQVANAKDRHHVRQTEQRSTILTNTQARNANALYPVGAQSDASRYANGWSAPAGH